MDYLKISTAVLLLVVSVSGRGVYPDGSSYKVYSSLDDLAKQNHYYEIPSGINNHDLNTENHKEEEESEEYDDEDQISQNQQQQEEDQHDQNEFDDQNQQEDQQQQEEDNEFRNQQQQKERGIIEKNSTISEAFQDSLEVMPLPSESNKYDVSKNQHSDDAVNPKESDDKIQEGNENTKPNYSNENSNKDNLVNDKEEGVDGVIIHTNIDAKDSVSNESDELKQGDLIKEVNNSEPFRPKPVGETFNSQTSNNDENDLTTTPLDTTTTHNKDQNHNKSNGPLEGDKEQEEQFTKRTISTTKETQDEREVFTTERTKIKISSISTIEADVTSLRSYSQHKEKDDVVKPDNSDSDTEQSLATSNEDLDESTVHNCGNYGNECKQREFTAKITTVSVTDEGESRPNVTEHIEKEEKKYNHDITVSLNTQGDSWYITTIENKDNNKSVIEQSTFASILTTNEIDKDIMGKHTTAFQEIQDDNTKHDLSTPGNVDKEIDSVGDSSTISRESAYNSGSLDLQYTEIESVDDGKISTIGIESENTKKVTKFTEPDKTTASVTKKDIMVEIDYTTPATPNKVETSSEKRENSNGGERIPVPEFVPQMKPNGQWNQPGRPWSHPHGSWDRNSGRWGQDYDQWDYDNYGPWSHNNPWDRHRPGPHHWPRSHQNYGHNDRSHFPSKGGR